MLEDKDQKRICIYCKKEMVYGLYEEVLSNKYGTIHYFQYRWCCKMEDDNCDMIFDRKEINDVLYQEAIKKLDSIKSEET